MTEVGESKMVVKPNGLCYLDGVLISCPKCKDKKQFLSKAGYIEKCREC